MGDNESGRDRDRKRGGKIEKETERGYTNIRGEDGR